MPFWFRKKKIYFAVNVTFKFKDHSSKIHTVQKVDSVLALATFGFNINFYFVK